MEVTPLISRFAQAGAVAAGLLLIAGCNAGTSISTPPVSSGSTQSTATQSVEPGALAGFMLPSNVRRACDGIANETIAQCDALVRTDIPAGPRPDVNGYGPTDLQAAYNLPSATKGNGSTIAIVDAFDDPNAESDLAMYRSYFGLPECSTKNGCFLKVNQKGEQGNYPQPNAGWALEISLDLDMVSAGCPNCHIILVEANTNYFQPLGISVNRAAKMGADAISNSYSAYANIKVTHIAQHYNHPDRIVLASSGDGGYGPSIPGGFPFVVSVGGTTLRKTGSGRGWSETVWSGTGGGCVTKQTKPLWQTDKSCKGRTQNDVAADADPATGVAIYDTYQAGGWYVVGGTSVSSPLLAAVYGLAGNAEKLNASRSLYIHTKHLYDVTSGRDGICTPPQHRAYLCEAETGYDGPTGNGTPNGIAAF
jgi:hypothetical protein